MLEMSTLDVMFFSGRIQETDSLFKYIGNATFGSVNPANFEPIFMEDVLANMTDAEKELANSTCQGNNIECMFDLQVTGKNNTFSKLVNSHSMKHTVF